MNIAIDIDDTLTDTFEYLMPFVAEFYEKDLDELQRNKISYSNIPKEWRAYEWDFEKRYYDKVVVRTPFKKDAARYVNLLHQKGHRIVIITGRTREFYTDPYVTTTEELKNGNIVYDKLICTLDKKQACLDEQIDVMIDDLISNCDSVSSVGIVPVLFTSQGNWYLNTEYARVNQWDDVIDMIEYIDRGYPDRTIANELLRNAEKMNPGPWGNHSRTVAHCAEKIALACGNMDSEKAYVLGLLHDIGRRFGVRHLGHVSDGYSYMRKLGFYEVARICLTHSFHNQSTEEYIGKFDTSEEERELIETALKQATMDDYDRLIQLCDAMAGSEDVLDIEERMNDVKMRYGFYPQSKWDANIALKAYVEKKVGRNIYDVVEKELFRPQSDVVLKLTLEPLGLKHLNTVHEYASDLENTRYMLHLPNETIDETKAFLERVSDEWAKEEPFGYELAVLLGDVHIGAVCAYLNEERTEAEIGWIINKNYWRKGYAYEASKLLLDFCKNELNIHRFSAVCDTENIGSYRVMEKLGMKRICERDGRKNRAAAEVSKEYQYEM